MQIHQRPSPNKNIGRALTQGAAARLHNTTPDFIVIHTTGGSTTSAINTILNRNNQVSYHFVISANGEITQAVHIKDTAWANGTNNTAGDNRNNQHSPIAIIRERHTNVNSYSVSIGLGDMPTGRPTDTQLDALVWLIHHIQGEVQRHYSHTIPLKRTNIIGHDEVTPITRPNCPGRAFPWDVLIGRLGGADVAYSETPQAPPNQAPSTNPPQGTHAVTLDILGNVQEVRGQIVDGQTWVRLTDFSTALGYTATWDEVRRIPMVRIAGESDDRPHMDAVDERDLILAAADLALLKKIVHWEARGEDEKGQILVVNVIFNRLNSRRFPNTIQDVILAPGAFTPTTRADFDTAVPNARTINAVNRALDGEDFSQCATFFHALRGIHPDVWHERATREGRLVHLFDHGGHRFYREA